MPYRRKIYLATSWRNDAQPAVLHGLRLAGHDVYDFRNPELGNHGFSWKQTQPDWKMGEPVAFDPYVAMLDHPIARHGFDLDFRAMQEADTCVLLLPCGRSAHMEFGWMVGNGRQCVVMLDRVDRQIEPELMYLMALHGAHMWNVSAKEILCNTMEGLLTTLDKLRRNIQ